MDEGVCQNLTKAIRTYIIRTYVGTKRIKQIRQRCTIWHGAVNWIGVTKENERRVYIAEATYTNRYRRSGVESR